MGRLDVGSASHCLVVRHIQNKTKRYFTTRTKQKETRTTIPTVNTHKHTHTHTHTLPPYLSQDGPIIVDYGMKQVDQKETHQGAVVLGWPDQDNIECVHASLVAPTSKAATTIRATETIAPEHSSRYERIEGETVTRRRWRSKANRLGTTQRDSRSEVGQEEEQQPQPQQQLQQNERNVHNKDHEASQQQQQQQPRCGASQLPPIPVHSVVDTAIGNETIECVLPTVFCNTMDDTENDVEDNYWSWLFQTDPAFCESGKDTGEEREGEQQQ